MIQKMVLFIEFCPKFLVQRLYGDIITWLSTLAWKNQSKRSAVDSKNDRHCRVCLYFSDSPAKMAKKCLKLALWAGLTACIGADDHNSQREQVWWWLLIIGIIIIIVALFILLNIPSFFIYRSNCKTILNAIFRKKMKSCVQRTLK